MPNTQPLRILVTIPFFYPHRGGSQKYVEDLYAAMVQQHPDVEVDILCYNTDNVSQKEKYRGLTIHRVPCYTLIPARFVLPKPIALIKLLGQLAKHKHTIVNPHVQFFDVTWWSWIYARFIGAKAIFTGHTGHATHQSPLVRVFARLVDDTIARASLHFYDAVTVENKATQQFFQHYYQIKDPIVVYGNVDTSTFTPNRLKKDRTLPNNQKVSDKDIIVSYVGRLIWTKGVTYAYDAAKEIVQQQKNVIFVLGGPGELEQELHDRVKQDGLEEKIIISGNLHYNQVRQLLQHTDIFIHPSHHNEGLPIILLEAGASGNFVIGTDVGGVTEIIQHRQTGLIVSTQDVQSLKDAIQWAIEHPDEREDMAQHLNNLIRERHDTKTVAEGYYRLLLQLTHGL